MRLKANFVRRDGLFAACSVSGHDPVAADKDYSILCAAVSSAMQLTCNTLTECFGVPDEAVTVTAADTAQNQIAVRLPSPDKVQSELLHGLLLHLQLLAEGAGGALTVTVTSR